MLRAFVTFTDDGVGYTWVPAALLRCYVTLRSGCCVHTHWIMVPLRCLRCSVLHVSF